jgi:hypothetical protein
MPKKGKKKRLLEQQQNAESQDVTGQLINGHLSAGNAELSNVESNLSMSFVAWGMMLLALVAIAAPFARLFTTNQDALPVSTVGTALPGTELKNVEALSIQGLVPPTISLNEGEKSGTLRTYRVSITNMTPLVSLEIRAPEQLVKTIEIKSLSGGTAASGDTIKKDGFISKRQPFAQGDYEISLTLQQDVPLSGSCADASQDTGLCVFAAN